MKKRVRTIVVLIIFVLFIVGVFYVFANKEVLPKEPVEKEVTVMEGLLTKNLEINYPPTPREVLKYYNDITKAIYDEEYSDKQIAEIAHRLRELFDAELVANQSEEEYISSLKSEMTLYRESGITISSYSISSSTDVETYKKGDDDFAKLYTFYKLRQEKNGTVSYQDVNQVFIMRKEVETGHWKIVGFDLVKQ